MWQQLICWSVSLASCRHYACTRYIAIPKRVSCHGLVQMCNHGTSSADDVMRTLCCTLLPWLLTACRHAAVNARVCLCTVVVHVNRATAGDVDCVSPACCRSTCCRCVETLWALASCRWCPACASSWSSLQASLSQTRQQLLPLPSSWLICLAGWLAAAPQHQAAARAACWCSTWRLTCCQHFRCVSPRTGSKLARLVFWSYFCAGLAVLVCSLVSNVDGSAGVCIINEAHEVLPA